MPQQNTRPNFVFIVADDLGYADLGCTGARTATSPHLDRMAAEGLLFTHGYSNSPVCSPTRFAMITGRWQISIAPTAAASETFGTAMTKLETMARAHQSRGRRLLGNLPPHDSSHG
ncbi:sulfatase-like hydrolase/transferase [Azohydromonas lata]|uniref:Sulfatase-like hydrolase/transferase n=1 Tax=Azohydromonas lata TaxID=45677 RepID=A0ABU5IDZ7_9BURK|nr:sulfatase-like hydrolase/transferase [Azohydromonas lata]MDZ5457339.1 sulfatase-like hydrolase/transferase [Azohydromonas lata]